MKKVLLLALLIPSFCIAQKKVDMFPRNAEHKVEFTEVVTVDSSITADQLYLRAKMFFVSRYKNANEVIQLDDKDNHVVIGKGFQIADIKAMFNAYPKMWTSVKIETKNGKYKYTINVLKYSYSYDAFTKTTKPDTFPEEWFDAKNYEPDNNKYVKYYEATKKAILADIEAIKKAMQVEKTKSDW